jgi:hypothetical protein
VIEYFSEQAGSGWIVIQPRGPCRLEEVVSCGSDSRVGFNYLQEVEQMGLDVVSSGLGIGVLLNLEKRIFDEDDPLLQHVGEVGYASRSPLALRRSTLVMLRCQIRLLPSGSKDRV